MRVKGRGLRVEGWGLRVQGRGSRETCAASARVAQRAVCTIPFPCAVRGGFRERERESERERTREREHERKREMEGQTERPPPHPSAPLPARVGNGVEIHPENTRMSGRHGVQYVAQCVAFAALTLVVRQ